MEDIIIKTVLGVFVAMGLWILKDFKATLTGIQKSIESLNVNIASLLEKDASKEAAIESNKQDIRDLDKRVDRLDTKIAVMEKK